MYRAMWMIVLGMFLVAGTASANCGHCGKGGDPRSGKQDMVSEHLNSMTKSLKLTAEQKPKVEALLKEKMEKKRQIMEQKEAAMDALQAEFQAKLKDVLTADQMKKWEARKDEMQGHCPDCKDGKPCKTCKLKGKGKMKTDDGQVHHGPDHK